MTAPMTTQPRTTHTEMCAGKRADFIFYYRIKGKLRFDPMWCSSGIAEAEKDARHLIKRSRGEFIRIEPRDPTAIGCTP